MIDHRASPGLPANFYDGMRYKGLVAEEGKLAESAVLVCRHCQRHVIKNLDRTRQRGYCRKCDGYVCDFCELNMRAADYVHTPFKKLIDEAYDIMAKGLDRFGMISGNSHLPLRTEKD